MARKGFIDLGRKEEMMAITEPGGKSEKKTRVYYPSLYLRNKDLGLDEKSVGKEMMAVVRLKVTNYSKNVDEKGDRSTLDFDVMGINLNMKKQSHYKVDNASS